MLAFPDLTALARIELPNCKKLKKSEQEASNTKQKIGVFRYFSYCTLVIQAKKKKKENSIKSHSVGRINICALLDEHGCNLEITFASSNPQR